MSGKAEQYWPWVVTCPTWDWVRVHSGREACSPGATEAALATVLKVGLV